MDKMIIQLYQHLSTHTQLYHLLSVYKILKPPKFGNCHLLSYDKENQSKITMEEFKTIFPSIKTSYHKAHVENLKKKFDDLVTFTDMECDNVIDHDYAVADVVDSIIYYVTGFVCKTMLKKTVCPNCRKAFVYDSVTPIRELPEAHLVNIKSRGKLIHPNKQIFQLFKKIEYIFAKNINSMNIYQKTMEDLLTKNVKLEFACNDHKNDIISYCIHYYVTLRMRQFAKQENHKMKTMSRDKKKLSKLCNN